MVTILETADGVRLGDVVANPGWTWSSAQADASALTVSFTDGTRALEFSASSGPDGEITAAVNEPIVAAVANGSQDHGVDGDDDEHEHEEHEGADDDD
jgi:hypothetical protein